MAYLTYTGTICIKHKTLTSDQITVKIREYIDPNRVFRSFDPQSGARLVFVPQYQVIMTKPYNKIEWLSYEEVYEKYPEFFK